MLSPLHPVGHRFRSGTVSRAGVARGVAIAPGVSLNNRLYTREMLRKAYERLVARIADPAGRPVVMRTHHDAGDDSTRIVGKVTSVALRPDGAITYEADLAPTPEGETIAALARVTEGEKPYLANVSVYGYFLGDVRTESVKGAQVTTADDLEIDAIDFTFSPGVPSASVTVETSEGRHPVSESTTASVKETRVIEGQEYDTWADEEGGFYFSTTWDGICVTISSEDVDPANLELAATAAVKAAIAALNATNVDRDLDVLPAVETPAGSPMESTTTPEAIVEASLGEDKPAMSEATEEVTTEATPELAPLTTADIPAIVEAVVQALTPAVESTEEEATEAPSAPTSESLDALRQEIKDEVMADLRRERVTPDRKGFGLTETQEVNEQDLWERRGDVFASALAGIEPQEV